MKKLLLTCLVGLAFCGGDGISGVDLAFIKDKFNLPDTATVVIDVDEDNACPKVEFDASNDTSFQVRFSENNPPEVQTTFKYVEDEYSTNDVQQILRGSNGSNTTFELIFNGVDTYTITVDYNCVNASQPGCINTTYSCSGPRVN